MARLQGRVALLVILECLVIGLLVAGAAAPIAAHHENPDDDLNQNTWLTLPKPSSFQEEGHSRKPGVNNASHQTFSQPGLDVDHWRFMAVRTSDPGIEFDDCSLADGRAIGIDRGANQDGTNVDDAQITNSFKNIQFKEHAIILEIAGPNDVQDTLPLRYKDQIVGWLVECYKNPEQPGWYNIFGSHNGTKEMEDGSLQWREWQWTSHSVWLCDCENKSEAIEKLGPPPTERIENSWRWGYENGAGQSADTAGEPPWHPQDAQQQPPEDYSVPQNTPTPTPAQTATATSTAAATATATSTAAATATATSTAAATATATSTDTVAETAGGGSDETTPTQGDGPGFGGPIALVALAAAALLVLRRAE